MKSKNNTLQHLGFVALAFAGFAASAVHAANDVWIGDTDANFATLPNWTGSVSPNNNTPVFGTAGSSGTTLNNDIVGATYAGLTFNSGASAYTIGGNSFTLTGNILNSSTSTQTINTAMTATVSRTLTATSGQLVIGGNITTAFASAGINGLVLSSANKITLGGTNDLSSNFLNVAGLTVSAGAGGVDITGSTTLNGSAAGNNGYLSVAGTTTLRVQSGGSLALNGTTTSSPNALIGQNTAGTSTLLVNGGTLNVGANNGFVLGNNNASAIGVLTIASGTATINRGTVATITNGTDTRLILMGRDSATGTINLNGGTLATDRQFVRDVSSNAGSGTAKFVFGGANTYTGNTTVNNGTLSVSSAWFSDTSTITIANSSTLNLNTGVTDTVNSLVIGGVTQAVGLYRATDANGGSAPGTPVSGLTGSGKLDVLSSPAGYATWAANNVGNQTPDEDFNSDGVDNGIAYFMNNTGVISLPGIVGGAVTWTNGGNIPASAYGTQFVVQTSPDLVNWTGVSSGAISTSPNVNTDGTLTFTLPTGAGKVFVRLVVTPN